MEHEALIHNPSNKRGEEQFFGATKKYLSAKYAGQELQDCGSKYVLT
jgi:hypothetical protein